MSGIDDPLNADPTAARQAREERDRRVAEFLASGKGVADLLDVAKDGNAEGRAALAKARATDRALALCLDIAEAALWDAAKRAAAIYGGPPGAVIAEIAEGALRRGA